MLIQSTLPSSIEATLSLASDNRKQDLLRDWIPSDETWQKCPKTDGGRPWDGCRESISSTRDKKENAAASQFLNHSRTCITLPPTRNMCASSPNFVYKRRKLQSNSNDLLSAQATKSSKASGACLSSTSSKDDHCISQVQNEIDSARVPVMAEGICNQDFLLNGNTSIFGKSYLHKIDDAPCTEIKNTGDMETVSKSFSAEAVSKSESIDGCVGGEEHAPEEAENVQAALEHNNVNVTISSSKSNMEHGSASTKADVDDIGECSSSFISQVESLSEKDLCISILRSHGLLGGVSPDRFHASVDLLGNHDDTNCSQLCKICGHSENSLKMLLCDNCEAAFHVSCCPRIKKMPVGDWNCQPCLRKKRKCSQESKKSVKVKSEATICRSGSSKSGENCIALMLKDTEPYTTGVRIGKAFQADVPDWSGPITEDFDCFGEPLELDPTEHGCLNGWNANRSSFTPTHVGNWLQCREVLDDSAGERAGTTCGKWRRAPLFEVQTDDWDCSCAVVWDRIHADCAVPQELETEEVLRHLKYVQLVMPRLIGQKKRKATPSQSETEDVRNEASQHGGDT